MLTHRHALVSDVEPLFADRFRRLCDACMEPYEPPEPEDAGEPGSGGSGGGDGGGDGGGGGGAKQQRKGSVMGGEGGTE
eukprot:g4017.t1